MHKCLKLFLYTNRSCIYVYILLQNWKCIFYIFSCLHSLLGLKIWGRFKKVFVQTDMMLLACVWHMWMHITCVLWPSSQLQTKTVAISFGFTPTKFFFTQSFWSVFPPWVFSYFLSYLKHAGTMAWNGSLTFFVFPFRNQTFSQLLNCAHIALKEN